MKSLCQQCFCFDCAWHMRFEEVEGWTAKKTTLTFCNGEIVESYQVTDCPLFRARDGSRWVQVSLDDVTRLLGIQRGTYTRAVVIEGRKSRELAKKGFELRTERVIEGDREVWNYFIRKKEKQA